MDSANSQTVYDPFQKQNIGRRTGKIIPLKNGPIRSIEDFFSDSEPDLTLNITKQTDDLKSSDKDLSSPTVEQVFPSIDSAKPVNQNYTENFKRLSSFKEIPNVSATGVINPFTESRYGRRTGKDVLAGKKKLIQSNGVGNFSDFFSDSDASYSLNPTPKQSSALESSFSSAKESDNRDTSSQGSTPQDKRKSLRNQISPMKDIYQKNKSLQEEKENNLSPIELTSGVPNKACRKSSSIGCNKIEVNVHFPQNSSKIISEPLTQNCKEQTLEDNTSFSSDGKSRNASSVQSDGNISDSEAIESRQSEENDGHPKSENADKERTLKPADNIDSLTNYESDKRLSETGKQSVNAKQKLKDIESSSCESSEFNAPHPRENGAMLAVTYTDTTQSHGKQESESENPITCVQHQNSKAKVDKSKASTPSKAFSTSSGIDFGGDNTGSLTQADKLTGKPCFGIKKRLTFSKAVQETDVQTKKLPSTLPEVGSAGEMMSNDEDNSNDFVIVENDEIVTSLSMTDEAKFSQKPLQKNRNSRPSSRRSAKHSQSKPLKDDILNQTSHSPKQETLTSINSTSNSSIKAKRKSIAKENRDLSSVTYEKEIYEVENKDIISTKAKKNLGTLKQKTSALENTNPVPFKDKIMIADPEYQSIDDLNNDAGHLKDNNESQNHGHTNSAKNVDISSSKCNKRTLRHRHKTSSEENVSSAKDGIECKSKRNKLKRDEKKESSISNKKGQIKKSNKRITAAKQDVKESSPRSEENFSSPDDQMDANKSLPVSPDNESDRNVCLKFEINSDERPPKSNKRQRRQIQPVQYPCEEIRMKRKRSNNNLVNPVTNEKDSPSEIIPVGKKRSKNTCSTTIVTEGKHTPLEHHCKQPRKSALRKSPDRRRTLSRKSSGKRKTLTEGKTEETEKNTSVSSPTHIHPLMMLPRITPKSGVSFRSRSSCFAFHENSDTSNLKESEDNMMASDHMSPVASKPKRLSTKRASTLRKKAIMNSAKSKRNEIEGMDDPNSVTDHEGESSTILPSPSSSPVHYLETTASERRSSIFQLPDFSNKIVPPEKAESGLRRSMRTKVKRLNRDMGEGIVYRRDSSGFGLLVDSVQTSSVAVQFFQREKDRKRKLMKKKFAMKTVPARVKRLSSHYKVEESFTNSSEIPIINPETNETVNIELMARSSTAHWLGPELTPVTTMDPVAVCLLLNQPFFGTGELHIRPFSGKKQQLAVHTLVYSVISGKISVTVNDVSFAVQTGDDFFIPRGSQYRLQNLRKDIAKIKFLNLKDNENNHHPNSALPL